MKIVDLNILLYAVNRDDAIHKVACRWWENALHSSEPVGLTWITLVGFVRVATHRNVFTNPQTPAQAIARVDAWLNHPNTELVLEGPNHWLILQQLILDAGTAGNLTTDAHLAALAISRGATLVSCDNDFRRFRQLRWENPLD